jgi:hypothetical protein
MGEARPRPLPGRKRSSGPFSAPNARANLRGLGGVKLALVKFCRADHHLGISEKIQLGSLEYFKRMENDDLRDSDEGTIEVEISHPEGVFIPRNLVGRALPGMVSYEGEQESKAKLTVSGRLPQVQMMSSGLLVRGLIKYRARAINSLVFCMSVGNPKKFNTVKEYKAKWQFPFSDRDRFASLLQKSVEDNLLAEWQVVPDARNWSNVDNSAPKRVSVVHRHVRYLSDRSIMIRKMDEFHLKKLEDIFDDIAFIKPNAFKGEREYRFVVKVHAGDDELQCTPLTVLLPAQPFRNILQ